MNYLLWWYFEGRPKARIKNFWEGLHYRMEGSKQKKKFQRQLPPRPAFKIEIEDNG